MKKNIIDEKYLKSIIYYFRCGNEIYIGSTCNKRGVKKRIHQHETDYRGFHNDIFTNNIKRGYRSSFEILKHGKYVYGVLEEYPCVNLQQLTDRERQWISAFREKKYTVVNKQLNNDKIELNIPHIFFIINEQNKRDFCISQDI
jgi:hypothetical protein|tara:strand:+ start:349 stop:780 length:432 start_codon:yes stop_codon:yes gene_type:complete